MNDLKSEHTYAQDLERWQITDEALTESRVHTKEKP